jgi:hypothetical protein
MSTERYAARLDGSGPDLMLGTAAEALREGEVVCLAGQAALARLSGDAVERERIGKALWEAGAPVVAISVEGGQGGALALRDGRVRWRWPRRLPARVVVRFGRPLAPAVGSPGLAEELASLGAVPESRALPAD